MQERPGTGHLFSFLLVGVVLAVYFFAYVYAGLGSDHSRLEYPANYHYYLVSDGREPAPSVAKLIDGSRPRTIMVSVEGGGILASGWATQVMTGIVGPLFFFPRQRLECAGLPAQTAGPGRWDP